MTVTFFQVLEFWNWGPVTIWPNLLSAFFSTQKSLQPIVNTVNSRGRNGNPAPCPLIDEETDRREGKGRRCCLGDMQCRTLMLNYPFSSKDDL